MHLELFASHLSRQASLYCILCMTQLFQCQPSNFFCKQSDRLNLAAGTCAVPRLNLAGQAGLDPALVSDVGRK